MVSPGVIRTDQANADQHLGVTTMPFEAPPAEGRQCISCGNLKPLNFIGLDQQEWSAGTVNQNDANRPSN